MHAGNRLDQAGRRVPRFPESELARVAASIEAALQLLRPTTVVSAPAVGADLIVLETAHRLGITLHVVVPVAVDAFVSASVADHGASWIRRFEQVIALADADERSQIEYLGLDDATDWWYPANTALILSTKSLAARSLTSVVALTVRPVVTDGTPSVTDDLAELAARQGWPVLTVDPRPLPRSLH